jgi:hypothetical protein
MADPNPPTGPPYGEPGPPYGEPVWGPTQPVSAWGGPLGGGPVIAQIGEVQVTSTTVRTPAGEFPLRGTQWTVTDQWLTEQRTPTWAIVLAVVGFCVLTFFSFFFLLVKQTTFRGVVQVSVQNGPHFYVARIPVTDQVQVQQIHQQVNYVRSVAAL